MMNIKKGILFTLTFIILIVCFIGDVDASEHGSSLQYFKTGRVSGAVLSSKSGVNIDKVIPCEYSFGLGDTFDDITVSGGEKLSALEIDKWKNKPGESNDYVADFMNGSKYVSRADDSIKGKFTAVYKNVGKYEGNSVDVKLTITDFAITSGDYYYNDYAPFIAFLGEPFNKIGVYIMNLDWVEVKYNFYVSGTNKPINVKGYTSYWDLDEWKGVHILDNNKGIYAQQQVELNVSDLNESLFIYDASNVGNVGKYNAITSFTELFEGTSITRVFTPARPVEGTKRDKINRARGMFYNSSVTAVARKEYAFDTLNGDAHSVVKSGNTVKYKVYYTNINQEHDSDVVIVDTLSKGLQYVKGSSSLGEPEIKDNLDGTLTLKWTTNLAKDSTGSMTYSASVTNDAGLLVNNSVKVSVNNHNYDLDPLYNPVPVKKYADNTLSGKGGLPVKKDNIIKYSIKYANPLKEKQSITISDTISKGLEYIRKSSKIGDSILEPKVTKNTDGTTTLVWITDLDGLKSASLTYMVRVTGGVFKVKNKASIKYEGMNPFDLNELINPLPTKSYAADSLKGKNGSAVKSGDQIKYNIKYVNTYSGVDKVTIIDTLSKGLSYVSGSAMVGNESFEPVITQNSNGITELVWTRKVDLGKEEELTYSVSVVGNTKVVKNKAVVKYGDKIIARLDELKNPVNVKIKVPNTASFLAIGVTIFGIALVCGGSYIIYQRYKVNVNNGGNKNEK